MRQKVIIVEQRTSYGRATKDMICEVMRWRRRTRRARQDREEMLKWFYVQSAVLAVLLCVLAGMFLYCLSQGCPGGMSL